MEWKRFPVTKFEYRVLKNRPYDPPSPISSEEEARIVDAAASGDSSVAGAYAVEPNPSLLEALGFKGEHVTMMLCALPGPGAHLQCRSYAWFNQRVFILDRNAPDAETIHDWHTPRPMNTLLGPEDGVTLNNTAVYVLNGRILSDHTRGNRVMIDPDWTPGDGKAGYRIIAACDEGDDNFHDSCLEFTWQS